MAQIKQTVFADDGTEFDTLEAAEAYEAGLKFAGNAEAYIQHSGAVRSQAGLLRVHLPQFLAWREANPDASEKTPIQLHREEVEAKREQRKAERAAAKAEAPAA